MLTILWDFIRICFIHVVLSLDSFLPRVLVYATDFLLLLMVQIVPWLLQWYPNWSPCECLLEHPCTWTQMKNPGSCHLRETLHPWPVLTCIHRSFSHSTCDSFDSIFDVWSFDEVLSCSFRIKVLQGQRQW